MKKILAVVSLVLTGILSSHAAILADWTFETSAPGGAGTSMTAATIGSITPETGSGTASGVHASSSTVWSNPQGNGSTESFAADHWATGDYFQFQTSAAGYDTITLSWEQTRSSTAPSGFKLAYSTDGTAYTDFNTYTVNENGLSPLVAWSGTYHSGYSSSVNLSTVTALNNDSSIYFRLIATADASNVGGTSRVDDFTISGDVIPVPEPAEWGLISGLGLLGICGVRTWREQRAAKRAMLA